MPELPSSRSRIDAREAVLRPTARVLLVDAAGRLLLLRCLDEQSRAFWIPVGGGVEHGESVIEAAVRELEEETGLVVSEMGPQIGRRRHVVAWDGVLYDCRENWFWLRIEHWDVDDSGLGEQERVDITEYRWWSAADLRDSPDRLVPANLAEVVADLMRDGPPAEILELEI